AFAVVAFLRNQTGSEDLSDFRGMVYRSPIMVVTLAFFLLSLLGLPPLAGFAAKFQIFSELYKAGQNSPQPNISLTLYTLLAVAVINTVLSLVYYVKVLKVMIVDRPVEEIEGAEPASLPVAPGAAFYATLVAAMTVAVFFAWNPIGGLSDQAARSFPLRAPEGREGPTQASRPRSPPTSFARSARRFFSS